MSIRDKKQNTFVNKYIDGERKGIFLISVRFGKTLMTVKIMKKLNVKNVLILFPNNTILSSWEKEFASFGWKPDNITFSTFLSADKHIREYDMVVCDEIHLLSANQRKVFFEINKINNNVLGLTGTIDNSTKWDLQLECGMRILEEYSSEEAIEDKIIADFKIHIIYYDVDISNPYLHVTKNKSWMTTDRKQLDYLTKLVNTSTAASLKFNAINRMRFINTSKTLKKVTHQLIQELKQKKKRFILYGHDTKFIDSLDIHTYHSKNKKDNLTLFNKKVINDLGLCKLANTGVTFSELADIIITNIDSNSENAMQKLGRSLILDNKEKLANIYILCSNEEFQKKWLKKALSQIDSNKITIKNL